MKKLTLLGLAFALLIGATFVPAGASAAAAPQGAGLVSSVLSKMERNRRDLKSLRANVIVQKVDARFGEEMSEGSVQYVPGAGRDANVRIDFSRPRQEVLAVENGQYVYFRPKMNTAYKGSSRRSPKGGSLLGLILNASGTQIRNDYDIDLAGQGVLYDGGPRVVMLKLTPKGGAEFKFAEIWVDDSSGMPVQMRVTERNGDSTLVRLTNIQKNARIPSGAFKISLPSGVKVINS